MDSFHTTCWFCGNIYPIDLIKSHVCSVVWNDYKMEFFMDLNELKLSDEDKEFLKGLKIAYE